MKNYFIRLFFGILTLGILIGVRYLFNIDLFSEDRYPLLLLAIPFSMMVGGWGGWYLYRRIRNKKNDYQKIFK
ncbi:hypothetical protein D1B31_01055 [Neobacillus notoginsengisoli]|uniref:Uncharacterized protein n=1 Tax=Neobacillus notoginsengisoli TaxID=1578198 RepID=A0A417Z035_9BACI|nr:hypothetical protein [Neobacillus notoginsengisoli]RHW43291.1 hypothetical protein D1B31_01055 [Neobacillus notoginsengisoli]